MNPIKVSVEEIENMALGDSGVTLDGVELRVVSGENDWSSEGKYETCTIVFTDGACFYRGCAMRSGSYFSDYTYNSEWDDGDADIEEVAQVERTVLVWEPVKEAA